METKNPDEFVEKSLAWMQFPSHLLIPPHSPGGGGLALYWKSELDVSILTSCQNFIDTRIKYAGKVFFATFLYGEPERSKRKALWETLSVFGENRSEPWFLTGDFNDIIDPSEKLGGPARQEGSFVDIRSFMAKCDLFDLKHTGNFLSWRGKRHEHLVHCRLDRAMANSSWFEVYPFCHSEYLRFEGSDHRPLFTALDLTKKKKRGIFRFDRRLKDNQEIKDLIKEAWNLHQEDSVDEKSARCRYSIITWTRNKQHNSQTLIEELRKELEEAMTGQDMDSTIISIINLKLLHAYKAEEDFWKQRSRLLWLALGDRNSGYFHAISRGRSVINKFSVVENNDGIPQFEEAGILSTITNYFHALFTSQENDCTSLVQDAIHPCISPAMNQNLIRIPSKEEIKLACFAIHPDKAPGPDGFSACFFQSNWDTVGVQVVLEIQSFFLSDVLPSKINNTHIRLIPKKQSPQKMVDYRPIALCTVFYKIIAKLMAKRLQPILHDLISENQSAFVPKRAITDNVLITHEMLHYLKTSKAKVKCYMAVKTDMSKAYDRLEWNFIEAVQKRMGFHPKWILWLMQCISTVNYSFLLNDSAQGQVIPSRGIRQGDPLSPYLFILCSEVLSGLCCKAQLDGSLPGIRVALGSPRVNHLLFADDTMFFCGSDDKSCITLLQIIKKYEAASGQLINKAKSSITFSAKTPSIIKDKAHEILGMQQIGGLGKYLGLPEFFGRKKRDMFNLIIDRIRQRAISWSSRFLSTAGKATMLKSVLAAMPTYTMSCFKLPGSLCKRIQAALTRFWWDSSIENKKMCWISWSKLAQAKCDGGLGFRDIPCFNDALLAKISWRILLNPSCLLAKILLGKYCKDKSFLECGVSSSASHGWRGVCIGRDLLKTHLGKAIGSGKETRVWCDPWLSLTSPSSPMGPPTEAQQSMLVADLICPSTKEWIREKVQLLLPEYAREIFPIKPSKKGAPDRFIWLLSNNGSYSAKTGYQAACLQLEKAPCDRELTQPFNWFKNLWNIRCQPKIKFFLWKLLRDALPLGLNLRHRGIDASALCPHCQAEESGLHLMFHCPFAREVWAAAPLKDNLQPDLILNLKQGLEVSKFLINLPPLGLGNLPLLPWILWTLWTCRNKRVFEQKQISSSEATTQAIASAREWLLAQPIPMDPASSHPRIPEFTFPADSILCCSDAAWREDRRAAGFGWTFSNRLLEVSLHGQSFASDIGSPLLAEAMALLLAQQNAVELGFRHVTFASDSLLLIKAINSESFPKDLYGILQDVLVLSSAFDKISFHFIPREKNSCANAYAKSAFNSAFIVPASVPGLVSV